VIASTQISSSSTSKAALLVKHSLGVVNSPPKALSYQNFWLLKNSSNGCSFVIGGVKMSPEVSKHFAQETAFDGNAGNFCEHKRP
tara:strand:- start:466 stop:720 length:255 start_codon:yes stop_codon:yes gene_type:complete